MLRRGEAERGFSMMLGRLFNPRDKGLLLPSCTDRRASRRRLSVCAVARDQRLLAHLMRRDPGEHPNGLIDFALCSTIEALRDIGRAGSV